jgi:hypothetical protein
MQWVCRACTETQSELQSKSDAKIDMMMKMMMQMQERLDRMDEKLGSVGGRNLEEKIEEVVERKLAEAREETQEKEKRKNNLIIVNLRESSKTTVEEKKIDDLTEAKKLLSKVTEVAEGELSDPVRLGRQGGKRPRMLRVTVSTEEKKKYIVKKAPELNAGVTDATKKVFVNNDMTPNERMRFKALREEKKERERNGETDLVIRGEKVVKRKAQSQRPAQVEGGAEGGAPSNDDAQAKRD